MPILRFQVLQMDRPPKSHKEIQEFTGVSLADQVLWLKNNGTNLASETLAFVYRFGRINGYKDISKIAAEHIIGTPNLDGTVTGGRCEEIIKNQAFTFGFLRDPNLLMDFRQECYKKLIEDLNVGENEKSFPEERFGRYLKLRAIDIGRSLASQQKTRDTTEEIFVQCSEPPPKAESIVLDDLTESELHRIILELPPKVVQAFWLE